MSALPKSRIPLSASEVQQIIDDWLAPWNVAYAAKDVIGVLVGEYRYFRLNTLVLLCCRNSKFYLVKAHSLPGMERYSVPGT